MGLGPMPIVSTPAHLDIDIKGMLKVRESLTVGENRVVLFQFASWRIIPWVP